MSCAQVVLQSDHIGVNTYGTFYQSHDLGKLLTSFPKPKFLIYKKEIIPAHQSAVNIKHFD